MNSVLFKGNTMKQFKIFISIFLCVIIVFMFVSCKKEGTLFQPIVENSTTVISEEKQSHPPEENPIPVITEDIDVSEIADYKAEETNNSQVGLVVDSWLKIVSIGESDGVLSALVRNTADFDVQYATLSVISGKNTAKFSITTLTAGSSMILKCENDIKFDKSVSYHSWKISDKVIFKEKLLLHTNTFQIEGEDGILSVKNISNKDIEGVIYIYYKTVIDGIYADGITYRASVDGIDKGEKVQIPTQHYKKDVSRIMFVTYA